MDEYDLFESLLLGVKDMTKKTYEEQLHELEEKEGKCFTICEISSMSKISETDIHVYLKRNNVKTFKLRHWRAHNNVTLVPKEEVLKILALKTPCLAMLRTLRDLQMDASVEDLISQLESYH